MGRELGRRRVRGGEKGERKNNGVFRGLVFWILTSQLCVCVCMYVCVCVCVCMCVCVCVCVCVRAVFLNKCNDCVLMGD